MMKYGPAALLVSVLLLVRVPKLQGQTIAEAGTVDTSGMISFTLFPPDNPFTTSDPPLEINLEFNIREFTRTKQEEEYHDARITYTGSDSTEVEENIRISARGNFRKAHCRFPPIKLNLRNTAFQDRYLNNTNSLKLVTHCRNSRTYEQYILKEYLCYRFYNLLTDYSYRVRLIKINYVDTEERVKTHTKYGFIIENENHLEKRISAAEFEQKYVQAAYIDSELLTLLAVFQYMIGNTDWSLPGLHNISLFKFTDPKKELLAPIPFDFDCSGMVNAVYAVPDPRLGITSVRERLYRGYCIHPSCTRGVFEHFLQQKDKLYNTVNGLTYLRGRHRKEMIRYLDEFFDILDDQKKRQTLIINSCRNK